MITTTYFEYSENGHDGIPEINMRHQALHQEPRVGLAYGEGFAPPPPLLHTHSWANLRVVFDAPGLRPYKWVGPNTSALTPLYPDYLG